MNTTYVTVTIVTAVLVVAVSIPDYIPASFVLKNSAEVGVPPSWLRWLATIKIAGAAGLLVGLWAIPYLGIAAGIGLVLFFIGAVLFHVRARAYANIYFPATYLLLSVASLALAINR